MMLLVFMVCGWVCVKLWAKSTEMCCWYKQPGSSSLQWIWLISLIMFMWLLRAEQELAGNWSCSVPTHTHTNVNPYTQTDIKECIFSIYAHFVFTENKWNAHKQTHTHTQAWWPDWIMHESCVSLISPDRSSLLRTEPVCDISHHHGHVI